MSSHPPLSSPPSPRAGAGAATRRGLLWRVIGWTAASLLVLLVVLLAGVSYYTTTPDFQRRVAAKVVAVLEDATGGKVELGRISFQLWHLAIEADDLVIHGLEGPDQAPYLSAAKIFIRVKINTFLSHTVGSGAQSHVGVSLLRVEQPHIHLIIDKDGKTNQPVPRHPSTSSEPVQNTLLDLQAGKVELADGLAVVNDRPVPFNLAARDLNAEVHYLSSTDRYGATVDLADLRTQMATQPEVQSRLHLTAELGRDMFSLGSLDFATGATSHITASALVEHFAKPEWQATVNGSLELKQIGLLGGLEGFTGGNVDLAINGRNCEVEPQAAQKNPHFWQRRNRNHAPPEAKMLAPSPDCKSGYLLVGDVKLRDAGYVVPNVRIQHVNAGAQLHVTPTELLFNSLTGVLPGGGTIAGDLKIENWLGEVPSSAPATSPTTVAAATTANNVAKGVGATPPVESVNISPVQRAHAYLTVTVNRITLRTILEVSGPRNFGDLGLDTQVSGPVKVEWGGPASDIASSVLVDANLKLSPSGQRRAGGANVPVTGEIAARFEGQTQVVRINTVNLRTPATTLVASGVLGVNNGDPLTNLNVNLQARDLGEFDQVLQRAGFQANGKKGSAALPILLHGTLAFNGTARGAVRNIDVKGHLAANDLALHLGSQADIHIDSVLADAEYQPNSGLAVASSTIRRGSAVLNVAGSAKPHCIVTRRAGVIYAWDNDATVAATVKLADAPVPDLLEIAGQASKIALTGTANINAQVQGTLANLNGTGNVTLNNGVAYGESYETVSIDAHVAGQQITATRLLVQAHGMAVIGNGSYNLASKHLTAQLAGNNLRLSKLDTVKKANVDADGVLTFTADANGTVEQPNLHAQLSLTDITAQGKSLGELNATAVSSGSTVSYDLHSTLVGAQVVANGQTSLTGEYQTEAKVTLANVDVANALALFSPGSLKANSAISGLITLNGPAAKPQMLTASANFDTFRVTVQGVELKEAEPIRASLHNGIASIDALHITGPDTDLSAGGTAQVLGDNNPDGGVLHLTSTGNLNLGLAHTFDPDLIASGRITFKTGVEGRLKRPVLTGNVAFENANLAYAGIPNGLSNLNGSMVFNQNRLELRNLAGTSGGGKITLGGAISYQKGLFADLTAKIDTVRVRLYGLSTTANADLRFQGNPQSLLLSGNVLITRFGVGPNVDFAAFAGTGGVPVPPDPDALTSKIRMDVHVASAPQLDFQNSYAKLAGTVDLTVRGTVAQPSVLGTIRITDGSATFAGTKYQLDRGVIYFSNPIRIDPTVDLDVSTRVENYDVTVGLHGSSTNLKPTYRSSPPLTEADIFNLLALGRTQEESQLNTQRQVQAGTDPTTSAILGGALNATVSSRVGKLFGAGSVKIDPAFVGTLGNSTARITVQEPLSKQLTLVFATNVNQSAQQLIQVQYQINDNTSLVATRDESGVFSIVYKIRQRYR